MLFIESRGRKYTHIYLPDEVEARGCCADSHNMIKLLNSDADLIGLRDCMELNSNVRCFITDNRVIGTKRVCDMPYRI